MRMHFSYNAVTSTEKVKVVVEPDVVEVAVQQRSILHTFLNVLEERVQTCVTTDRGHVHSSGRTISEFFLRHLEGAKTSGDTAPEETRLPPGIDDDGDDDDNDGPSHGEGKHRGNEESNEGRKNCRVSPGAGYEAHTDKKPRTHCEAPLDERSDQEECAFNTSCSTVAHFDIHSDDSEDEDDMKSDVIYEAPDFNESTKLHVASQTDDTIPPSVSVQLVTSPLDLSDVAISECVSRLGNAFSSLWSALAAVEETAVSSNEFGESLTCYAPDIEYKTSYSNENPSADAECFVQVRLLLVQFQYTFAEAMEYLNEGWCASDVVNSVIIDKADDDACMRVTNACMCMALRGTIELYSPFCASGSEIHIEEAVDAIDDHLYASSYDGPDRSEIRCSVRAKFNATAMLPFLEFVALQAGDYDSLAPFWSDEVQTRLVSTYCGTV